MGGKPFRNGINHASAVRVSDSPPLGIVGDGRVASHFLHYLRLLDHPVRAWARRTAAGSPVESLVSCETVLLLIRDDEIEPFVRRWPALLDKRLVHFSGSLVTTYADAAHPLMTFGRDLYDLDTYRSIPFVLDDGATPFQVLLPHLPNPWFTIPAAERPYYHALCVMAGNFSTLLWLKLFEELHGRYGIPPSAVHPYLAQTATNLQVNPGAALTGPLCRGDMKTVDANLKALAGDPFGAVYAAFVSAFARRAYPNQERL
jgi:2-dehydropantoate 2-reductase